MRSVHSASSAFRRLVSFELRRFVTPFRMVLAMVSLVAMVVLARATCCSRWRSRRLNSPTMA